MLSNARRSFFDRCSSLVQSALPAACALCGAGRAPEGLCGPCAASLPALPAQRCTRCALPLESGTLCGECLRDPPHYDEVAAAFAYAFPIDALIHRFKYGGDLWLTRTLAGLLGRACPPQVDVLIPVPLAPGRLRERGFNQALEIARNAGRATGLPVLAAACRRVVETAPQAGLTRDERARNMRRAFVCDVALERLRIGIVDDVMTTGATMDALARNLKRAGAVSVSAWVIARTRRD